MDQAAQRARYQQVVQEQKREETFQIHLTAAKERITSTDGRGRRANLERAMNVKRTAETVHVGYDAEGIGNNVISGGAHAAKTNVSSTEAERFFK